jgi:hypothetical protein
MLDYVKLMVEIGKERPALKTAPQITIDLLIGSMEQMNQPAKLVNAEAQSQNEQ